MNSNNNLVKYYNYQQIPVKVCYFTKDRIIHEKQFFLNSTLYSVLYYFDKNIKEEGKTQLKRNYIYNNKIINLNEPLINLIKLKKNSSSSTIESVEILVEIEQIDIIGDEHIPYFDIIIQPKTNPFGIFVYKVKEGLINLQIYPDKFSKKYELYKFNDFSAYCNTPKSLFISGGKLDDTPIKDFWIINNLKYNIIKKNMPVEKSNHSMVYININENEYIFIAGGDNNIDTFYYDIKLNKFENWGNMNTTNIKPTLYQYKNYLYSFNSFSNYDNYFERTDLLSQDHLWEKIFPVFDNDTINFKTQSFGVSSCINECILLVGGENIKPKNLIYDPINNFLSLSEKGKNENIILSDKLFYKVNKYHNVALPSTLKEKKQIVVVNKIKQAVRLINFNVSDGVSKVKFNQNDFGKLIVKAKIHERLRFEIQPEIVSAQNLMISKTEPNLNEQEIINVEMKPEINESNIYTGKTKITKKNKYLYLSPSVIYNNLIEILVENDKNKYNNSNILENYINSEIIEKHKGDKDVSNLMGLSSLNNDYNVYPKSLEESKTIINNNNAFEVINNNTSNKVDDYDEDIRQVRDLFENTIVEPLGHDIILIEEYYESYYDINNFADYQIPEKNVDIF